MCITLLEIVHRVRVARPRSGKVAVWPISGKFHSNKDDEIHESEFLRSRGKTNDTLTLVERSKYLTLLS